MVNYAPAHFLDCRPILKSFSRDSPTDCLTVKVVTTMLPHTNPIFTIGEAAWSTNGVWGEEGGRRSKKILYNNDLEKTMTSK